MTDLKLYTKITSLPASLKSEVVDFIDYLEHKKKRLSKRTKKPRIYGYARNAILIKPGFDDPLEDFKEFME